MIKKSLINLKGAFALFILLSLLTCEKQTKDLKPMAQETINVGSSYDDPSADLGRDGFVKVNNNFDELYFDKIYRIPIGSWDMSNAATKTIDITAYNPTTKADPIILAVVIEPNSPATESYPLNYSVLGSVELLGSWYTSDQNTIVLQRVSLKFFDDTPFSGSVNRGYVLVHWYEGI